MGKQGKSSNTPRPPSPAPIARDRAVAGARRWRLCPMVLPSTGPEQGVAQSMWHPARPLCNSVS